MFPFYYFPLDSNLNGKNNNKPDIADWVGFMLFITGCVSLISGVIYTFIGSSDEKWFTRLFLSMVCFGFYAIIKKLSK